MDEAGKRAFMLDGSPDRLLVTQGDVRQVQLAKGAILSGFMALLEKAGIAMKDLDKAIVAGQFGAHLSADSITGTGILPAELEAIEYGRQHIDDRRVYGMDVERCQRGWNGSPTSDSGTEHYRNYERLFSTA